MNFHKKITSNKLLLIICASFILNFLQVAPAQAAYTDCLDIGYPSASIGSSNLTILMQVKSKCTNSQFGLVGGSFVYSILDESFMANCSGGTRVSEGYIGTVTCTIPIGESNGSSRIGATSTTIKIWSPGDFSTKFVTANHSAIPSNRKEIAVPVPTQAAANPLPVPSNTPSTNSSALATITSLAENVASLKALIVTLTNLVLKIQRTVKIV